MLKEITKDAQSINKCLGGEASLTLKVEAEWNNFSNSKYLGSAYIYSSEWHDDLGTMFTPVVQLRKQRHRKLSQLTRSQNEGALT